MKFVRDKWQIYYVINHIKKIEINGRINRWMQTISKEKPSAKNKNENALNTIFGKYLLLTNTISSGFQMMIGDAICQEIEYNKGFTQERWSVKRISQMFLVGIVQGPPHHYFYTWLDYVMPLATTVASAYKILIDQIITTPLDILLFLYPACLLEGQNLHETHNEISEKFLTLFMAEWLIWPVVQFINFRYVQPKYRVTFVNGVTMLYNVFLSYVKHEGLDNGKRKM